MLVMGRTCQSDPLNGPRLINTAHISMYLTNYAMTGRDRHGRGRPSGVERDHTEERVHGQPVAAIDKVVLVKQAHGDPASHLYGTSHADVAPRRSFINDD